MPPTPLPPPVNVPGPSAEGERFPGALRKLLNDYRARQRRTLVVEALCWAVGAAVIALVAAGLLGQPVTWLGRLFAALAVVVPAGLFVWFGVVRVNRQVGDDRRTARKVGAAARPLGDDALSAIELETALDGDERFSRDLARAFLDDVDRRAAPVKAQALIDDRWARRSQWGLVATLLAAAIVVGVFRSQWLAGLTSVLGAHTEAAAVVRHEPITGDVELTYKYPAYTGLPPRTQVGTHGEISAPAGTEVTLKTRSDRAVRRAEVVVNGKVLPLQVQGERDLQGSFVVDQSGSYHFQFVNALGRTSARGPELPIKVEADTAPKVEIQLPGAEVEIDPGEKVTLRYEASDDFGLTGLELVMRTPGGKEQRIPLPREDGRRMRDTYSWDLGPLKLTPGDRVAYHIEAKDNDAIAGEKKGVSRTQVVRVYSAAEHRRAAREKVEALWERLVLQLADRLEGGDLQSLDPQTVQANGRHDDAGLQLAQDMMALAGELAQGRDSPEELATALVTISESYGRVARHTRDTRRIFVRYQSRQDLAREFGPRLTAAVGAEVAELEKDILYLESLIDRRKLEDLRDMARELKRERQELASLMEDYQKSQDPEVRQQILEQLQELRRRMDELSQKMSELASTIRDEHLNAEALQEMMQEQDLSSQLDDIERLMREGKTDEAMKKLQEMSMKLDEMLENLDEADEQFGEDQFPELAEKFKNFVDDLEKTTQAQKDVAKETKALRDRYREKMKDRLQKKGAAVREQLMKKLETVAKDYEQIDPSRLGYSADRSMQTLQSELENAKNALKMEDFALAAEATARAERAAEDLKAMGEQQAVQDELWGNPPDARQSSKQLAERLEKDADVVRDVNETLQSLFPPAGSMMSQEDQKQLKELSNEQKQLQQQAQKLQQQMDELGEMAPIFDQETQQQMSQVGERMGQASERMQGRDPARGYGEQQAALDQMQQIQRQMQEARKSGGKKGGLPMPMMSGRQRGSGQGNMKEDVEIPDAEKYQAPREFRKDLLDAMKQGAPEKYRDQVKRYYEELVR